MESIPDGGHFELDSGPSIRTCGVSRGACDVVAQDCADPNHGCYFASEDVGSLPSTMCREPNMNGGDGDACSYVNDCLPGFTCTNDRRCHRYCCTGSSDCPAGSGQHCIGLAGAEEIGVCMSSVTCDLRTNEGCSGGNACYVFDANGSVGCFAAGTRTEGMSCTTLNECASGMGCFQHASPSPECSRYCRFSMAGVDCGGGGRTCAAVAGISLPPSIGICL